MRMKLFLNRIIWLGLAGLEGFKTWTKFVFFR
jgi:hypothetical protein